MTRPTPRSDYWPRTLRLSAVLLCIWFVLTVSVALLGPAVAFDFFGWPFGFWATTQGALLVYCLIVWYYAWAMNRMDKAEGDISDD